MMINTIASSVNSTLQNFINPSPINKTVKALSVKILLLLNQHLHSHFKVGGAILLREFCMNCNWKCSHQQLDAPTLRSLVDANS